jgi:hypothetical protein
MRTRTDDLLPDLRLLAMAAVATGLALWLALSAVRLSGPDAPAAPRIAPTLDSPSAAPLMPETAPASAAPATTLSPVGAPPQPAPTQAPTVAPARSLPPSSPAPTTAPGKVEPFPGNTLDMPIDPPLGAAPWGPPLP